MSDIARIVAPVTSIPSRAVSTLRHGLTVPIYLVGPIAAACDIALAVNASIIGGVAYQWYLGNYSPDLAPYVAIGLLAGVHLVSTLSAVGGYRLGNLIDRRRQSRYLTWVWIGVFLVLVGLSFFLKIRPSPSRGGAFSFFALGLLFLLAWRELLARALVYALGNGTFSKQKVIIIGDRQHVHESRIVDDLRHYGYVPTAIVQIDAEHSQDDCQAIAAEKCLHDALNSVIARAREFGIEDVLVAIGWDRSQYIDAILNALSVLPVRVYLVPDDNIVRYLKRSYRIGELWTAELKRAPLNRFERRLKRTIDMIGAAVGLILLSPVMLMAALLTRLDAGAPVLFSQWRSGFNGRSFRIFKFRTMKVLEDGPVIVQARRDDPRVTRIGRWLRRTNIDELPQLFNVLRGEMSLVGPRPHAVAHDSEYERKIADYAMRFQLKPGITGWAQVHGYRGETHTVDLMSKRIEFDLWYIRHWSIWLDLKILIGTVANELWRPRGY